MSVTIKDLARELRLSVSTVSYALNNGPKPVSAEVRDRVLKAALENGYRPNRIARSLVTKRTHAIGLVPPGRYKDLMRSQFMQFAMNGIMNCTSELGYDIVLFTGANDEPGESLASIFDARVDGVVFLALPRDSPLPSLVLERRLPVAVVATGTPALKPSFGADNGHGIGLAVSHLVELGHRRIGHVTGVRGSVDGDGRRDAFLFEMARNGLTVDERFVVEGDFTVASGRKAARELLALPLPPTAVVCANDEEAYGALLEFSDSGLHVPEDISIVGFDDLPLVQTSHPPLTSIRQPIEDMAVAAIRAVVAQIEGQEASSVIFSTELIVRQSTGRPKEQQTW